MGNTQIDSAGIKSTQFDERLARIDASMERINARMVALGAVPSTKPQLTLIRGGAA